MNLAVFLNQISHVGQLSTHRYTSCLQKNVPPLTCYNVNIHRSITTIYGTSVTEK